MLQAESGASRLLSIRGCRQSFFVPETSRAGLRRAFITG
jgi:hypothetical protein